METPKEYLMVVQQVQPMLNLPADSAELADKGRRLMLYYDGRWPLVDVKIFWAPKGTIHAGRVLALDAE
jgi:hypothetical protein